MTRNIAVITGGAASEVGIALKSAGVVVKYLRKAEYNVFKILIDGTDWWYVEDDQKITLVDKNDFTLTLNDHKLHFDAVFIAIHGTPAEDGKLQGYFDLLNMPYNTCGVFQAALTFDKQRTKEYLSLFGIKSAKAIVLRDAAAIEAAMQQIVSEIPFPVFVKPNRNGSSYGAAKVELLEDLETALLNAFNYDDEVLVEEYLKGREVTNGVFTKDGVVKALPITEIITKNSFFDYKAKYEGDSKEVTPAEIDADLTIAIQENTKRIYQLLGMKGMSRIDYIITSKGFYMLEVNSIPGLSEESIIPQQARDSGYTLEEFFTISIEECLRK